MLHIDSYQLISHTCCVESSISRDNCEIPANSTPLVSISLYIIGSVDCTQAPLDFIPLGNNRSSYRTKNGTPICWQSVELHSLPPRNNTIFVKQHKTPIFEVHLLLCNRMWIYQWMNWSSSSITHHPQSFPIVSVCRWEILDNFIKRCKHSATFQRYTNHVIK